VFKRKLRCMQIIYVKPKQNQQYPNSLICQRRRNNQQLTITQIRLHSVLLSLTNEGLQIKPGPSEAKTSEDCKSVIVKPMSKVNLLAEFSKMCEMQLGKFKSCKIEDFEILKTVGKGAYAEVKEAIHKSTREVVALKIYEKSKLLDQVKRASLLREIRILESLNHPNIVKIYACIDDGNKIVIVLELVKGIPLKTYLQKKENVDASESEKLALFKQIAMAIAYCHSKSVAHRDLKMENILITPQKYVKIIDFGFSVRTKPDRKCKILCGTPNYMAPEIISKHEYYPQPTDVWALGVILYHTLCGVFPFQSN